MSLVIKNIWFYGFMLSQSIAIIITFHLSRRISNTEKSLGLLAERIKKSELDKNLYDSKIIVRIVKLQLYDQLFLLAPICSKRWI